MEVFKDIKGFEGKYQVSNMGNVKSLNFNNTKKERLLSAKGLSRGYPTVSLGDKGSVSIHRLVAEVFLKRPTGKDQINHINGIKTDNRAENLEWVDAKENMQHALRTGLWKPNTSAATKASQKKNSVKVNQFNKSGELVGTFPSISDAQRITGIKHISCVILNKRKSSGGYTWRRVD